MIAIEELREFLRDNSLPDVVLGMLRDMALRRAEAFLGYSFAPGTYEETIDTRDQTVYLSHAPIQSARVVNSEGIELADFKIIKPLGILIFNNAPENAIVTYTAGYTALPEAIKGAVLVCAQAIYQRLGGFGATKESIGGYTIEYADDLPALAKELLFPYWRPPKC